MDAAVKIALEMLVLGGQKTDRFPWRPSGQGRAAQREKDGGDKQTLQNKKKNFILRKNRCVRAWGLGRYDLLHLTVSLWTMIAPALSASKRHDVDVFLSKVEKAH
jgi:hypothetical protein